MMGSLTLLLAASAAARTTDRIIRFKDAAGAIHTGAYEGRGVASLVDGWEVLDQKVEVVELLAPVERPPYCSPRTPSRTFLRNTSRGSPRT